MSEEKQPKRGKQAGYNSTVLWAKREAKREEAETRNARYNRLSTSDKIKLAKSRPGESKREVARLEARRAAEKAAAVKTPPATEAQKAVKAVKRSKDAAKAANR